MEREEIIKGEVSNSVSETEWESVGKGVIEVGGGDNSKQKEIGEEVSSSVNEADQEGVGKGVFEVEGSDDSKQEKIKKIKDFILSLKREIAQRDKKIKEYEDMIKRLAADFDNYRKRVSKEKIEYTRFANKDLILDLLPIMDNFDRALLAIDSANLDENVKEIFVGIKLIHKELINILMKYGVVKIDVEGNIFDPNISEVVEVEEVEVDDEEKDIVVKEYVKGYKMYDQVIRPAKVKVRRLRKRKKENDQPSGSDKLEGSEGTGNGGISSPS